MLYGGDPLVAALTLEVAVPTDVDRRAVLIPFAVELVDVGRAEGSPEVRRHVP